MSNDVSYEFGKFHLCPGEQQLLYDGNPVPLTNKAFETLQILVSNNGHLVEKSEIMSAVWKDSFIEEGNLALLVLLRTVPHACFRAH